MGIAILCFLGAGVLAFLAAKPHTAWRLDEGWRYRNRDAVEPSNAYLSYLTVGYGIGAVVLAIFGFLNLDAQANANQVADCEEKMTALSEESVDFDRLGPLRAKAEELGVRIELEKIPMGSGDPLEMVNAYEEEDEDAIGQYSRLMGWSSFCD